MELNVQLSDQELIERCREGDIDAFGQVYARYERMVYQFVYHMLGDPDDADNVKQDTFLKVYRSLPSFRGQCGLLTWLLKVAANLCRDRLKSRARRGEVRLVRRSNSICALPTKWEPSGALIRTQGPACHSVSGAGRLAGRAAGTDRIARRGRPELSADRRCAGMFGRQRQAAAVPRPPGVQRSHEIDIESQVRIG